MMRPMYKFLLVVAVLAGTIAIGSSQADAYWGRAWYGPVGWSHYGSYWSGCYDCGYWGVRPGVVRRAVWGPYRWYGGYGWDGCGCGWGCGYSCGWDTCGSCCGGAVVGAVGCCGDGVVGAPAANPAPAPSKPTVAPPNPGGFVPGPSPAAPTTPPSLPPSTSTSPVKNGSGLLTIFVPEDAKVFVNGYETKSTGAQRRYVSHGLTDGLTYKYEVRAQVVRDGKTLEEVRNVFLTSGAREGVAFNFNATSPTKDLAVVF